MVDEGFYTQQTWSEDRPLGRLAELVELSRHTELILVSGDVFADEMRQMYRAILDAGGTVDSMIGSCPTAGTAVDPSQPGCFCCRRWRRLQLALGRFVCIPGARMIRIFVLLVLVGCAAALDLTDYNTPDAPKWADVAEKPRLAGWRP